MMFFTTIITTVVLLLASLTSSADATFFSALPPVATGNPAFFSTVKLNAKNTNKNKKRIGGPRGGGRRGKPKRDGLVSTDDEDQNKSTKSRASLSVPKPTKFQKHVITLDRYRHEKSIWTTHNRIEQLESGSLPESESGPKNIAGSKPHISPLNVCIVEVDDPKWWEDSNNDNPYGARVWPSSLAIAEFLSHIGNLKGYDLLELGCGNGLISIVGAEIGARVVASDISPTVIRMTQIGWTETQKQRQGQKKQGLAKEAKGTKLEAAEIVIGTLDTFQMDLFSSKPLPLPGVSSSNKMIVVAAAMLYDSNLAKILAHRAFEACARGAWVIIGDDDSGEREGGRQLFMAELNEIEKRQGLYFERKITNSVVKSRPLNWNAKQVKLLHLNVPSDVIFSS